MALLKKIFKPVFQKYLDKVIPNEIKPALPYLAAFAPCMFGPASVQGFIGSDTMLRRALVSGALNVGATAFSKKVAANLGY